MTTPTFMRPERRYLPQWLRLLIGFLPIYGVFELSADALGSDRGQGGIVIALLVIAATAGVSRVLFDGKSMRAVLSGIGLKWPNARGMLVGVVICAVLTLVPLLISELSGTEGQLDPGFWLFLPGLFAQAGIAEELLFRGYVYGHFRRAHSFLVAATLAALPFVAIHALLFLTLPWPVALASLALSACLSYPFAYLYELGGATIWPGALVHFVIQATPKVLDFEGTIGLSFSLVWIIASAVVPLSAFLFPLRSRREHSDDLCRLA